MYLIIYVYFICLFVFICLCVCIYMCICSIIFRNPDLRNIPSAELEIPYNLRVQRDMSVQVSTWKLSPLNPKPSWNPDIDPELSLNLKTLKNSKP